MWAPILSLITKELLALLRDPRGRMVLIAPPLIQLFVFTFAAGDKIKDIGHGKLAVNRG